MIYKGFIIEKTRGGDPVEFSHVIRTDDNKNIYYFKNIEAALQFIEDNHELIHPHH